MANSGNSSLEWSDLFNSSSSGSGLTESASSHSSDDEESSDNETSSSQIDSDEATLNLWLTGGANGLQTADTETFEIEEVPYSSTIQKTMKMVCVHRISMQ